MARNIEDIKNTIKKLKEITVERGAAENEAAIAAKVMQNLLIKHHLELNEIEDTEENKKKEIKDEVLFSSGRLMWYDESLFANTREYFLISIYKRREPGKKALTTAIHGVGWEEDILIYREFITFVMNIMKKTFIIKSKNNKDLDRNDFYRGFIQGIKKSLEENKEANKEQWSLIVVNKDLEKAVEDLHLKKSTKTGIKPKFKNQMSTFSEGFLEGKRAHDYYKNHKDEEKLID